MRGVRFGVTCLSRAVSGAHLYKRVCARVCVHEWIRECRCASESAYSRVLVKFYCHVPSAKAKPQWRSFGGAHIITRVANRSTLHVGRFATHAINARNEYRYTSQLYRPTQCHDRCDWPCTHFANCLTLRIGWFAIRVNSTVQQFHMTGQSHWWTRQAGRGYRPGIRVACRLTHSIFILAAYVISVVQKSRRTNNINLQMGGCKERGCFNAFWISCPGIRVSRAGLKGERFSLPVRL